MREILHQNKLKRTLAKLSTLSITFSLIASPLSYADVDSGTEGSSTAVSSPSNADKNLATRSNAVQDGSMYDEDGFLRDGEIFYDFDIATVSDADFFSGVVLADTAGSLLKGAPAETGVSHVEINSADWNNVDTAQNMPVEFVFVIDATGSMGPYISGVRDNISAFAGKLAEKGISMNMSVLIYKDIDADGAASTEAYLYDGEFWTQSADEITEMLADIEVSGGGDNPEIPQDALNEYMSILEKNGGGTGKNCFAFLLTDADYKDSTTKTSLPSMDEIASKLREYGAKVSVVSNTEFKDIYRKLYSLTGGKFIDINTPNYYELMLEIANWVTENVTDNDTDGDGLWDSWEENGIDIDLDGKTDINLKDFGADKNVKDIFVEVDWFKGRKPKQSGLDMVARVFKEHGINLHIDAGPDSVDYVTGKKWKTYPGGSGGNEITDTSYLTKYQNVNDVLVLGTETAQYSKWNKLVNNVFTMNRRNSFHHCVFVPHYAQFGDDVVLSTGIAEGIPGQFFMCASLDPFWDSDIEYAGTFMHELGHTLALTHGGGEDDHMRYKPNHLSIMNYSFQLLGLKKTGTFGQYYVNYSEHGLPALDERSLDEYEGIDPENLYNGEVESRFNKDTRIKYIGKAEKSNFLFWDTSKYVDFNRNGKLDAQCITYDINSREDFFTSPNLKKTTNEWARLQFDGNLIGDKGIDLTEKTDLIIADTEYHEEEQKEIELTDELRKEIKEILEKEAAEDEADKKAEEERKKASSDQSSSSSSGGGGGSSSSFLRSGSVQTGGTWKQDGIGWWYQYHDGRYPSNGWALLTWNGHSDWYYFDERGYMKTGWVFVNDNWYYLNPISDGWLGKMLTGWQTINGKSYYFETESSKNMGHMYHDQMTPDNVYVNMNGEKT